MNLSVPASHNSGAYRQAERTLAYSTLAREHASISVFT